MVKTGRVLPKNPAANNCWSLRFLSVNTTKPGFLTLRVLVRARPVGNIGPVVSVVGSWVGATSRAAQTRCGTRPTHAESDQTDGTSEGDCSGCAISPGDLFVPTSHHLKIVIWDGGAPSVGWLRGTPLGAFLCDSAASLK